MLEHYKTLFENIEKLKSIVEEKEKLDAERHEKVKEAVEYANNVVALYREKLKQNDHIKDQAENENEKNTKKMIELRRCQIESEAIGKEFAQNDELERLRVKISTHNIEIETIKQIRKKIKISIEEQTQLEENRSKVCSLGDKICKLSNDINILQLEIKGNILNCLGNTDLYIESRKREFMPAIYKEIAEMQKEEIE